MKQKGFTSVVLVIIVIIAAVSGLYYYNAQRTTPTTIPVATSPTPTIQDEDPSTTPAFTQSVSLSPTKITQVNGADVKNIKYTLPAGWNAKVADKSLTISPPNGGYITVAVYSFSENMGRREYYCQISGYCIDGTTTFEEITLGNIPGYEPHGLDSSGSGPEYFGEKGNKFYRISTFCPSLPSDEPCGIHRTEVIASLVF